MSTWIPALHAGMTGLNGLLELTEAPTDSISEEEHTGRIKEEKIVSDDRSVMRSSCPTYPRGARICRPMACSPSQPLFSNTA